VATYINDFSHAIVAADTFRPQTLTATTNGLAVDAAAVGGNSLSARLSVGAVSGTSPTLNVKIQASPDGSGSWVDITGATFTQVTTANQAQTIRFQLPPAASTTAPAYRYVRAVATIGGTSPSFALSVAVFGLQHHPQPSQGAQFAPPDIN
jgi:hypothetical protein